MAGGIQSIAHHCTQLRTCGGIEMGLPMLHAQAQQRGSDSRLQRILRLTLSQRCFAKCMYLGENPSLFRRRL